jgi:hypothetical protein
MQAFEHLAGRQHVCKMRGMILINAKMVSRCHVTEHRLYQAPVECLTSQKHGTKAGQVDESYFVLSLSIHRCLQQLPGAMA